MSFRFQLNHRTISFSPQISKIEFQNKKLTVKFLVTWMSSVIVYTKNYLTIKAFIKQSKNPNLKLKHLNLTSKYPALWFSKKASKKKSCLTTTKLIREWASKKASSMTFPTPELTLICTLINQNMFINLCFKPSNT